MKISTRIFKKQSGGNEDAASFCRATYLQAMIKGQKQSEIILYAVLWALLFAAPVISLYLDSWQVGSTLMGETAVEAAAAATSATGTDHDWQGVFSAWSLLGMFCVTFFVHNFLIAPLLVYRDKKWQYAGLTAMLIVAFTAYQLWGRPHRPEPGERMKPEMERVALNGEKGMAHERRTAPENGQTELPGGRPEPGMGQPHKMGKGEPMGEPMDGMGPKEPPAKPQDDGMDHPEKKDRMHEPPQVFGGQDSVAFIIMALLLGLNIGIKFFFKSLDDRKRMKELERENLTNQLAYLKYQINPHFFMNTLNNIHALVDIDAEQAKYTIEVLSKMMRYVLYEGNKSMAPLKKELDFLANYIELMRIRYTDRVRISVSFPPELSPDKALTTLPGIQNAEIPSMLLINFVENAFKHGVSYQSDSFIEVMARIDENSHELEFLCYNSRKPASEEKPGGVGLKNTIKRLQLIYGKDGYDLHIYSNEEEYKVLLRLPITS